MKITLLYFRYYIYKLFTPTIRSHLLLTLFPLTSYLRRKYNWPLTVGITEPYKIGISVRQGSPFLIMKVREIWV